MHGRPPHLSECSALFIRKLPEMHEYYDELALSQLGKLQNEVNPQMVREMTEMNIRGAFACESQAHMRYSIHAERAKKEGFPNVARLFTAVAYAEKVHATNHHMNRRILSRT